MKFDHVIAMMQETKDLENLSIENLQGSLILHEQRINEKLKDILDNETIKKTLQMS